MAVHLQWIKENLKGIWDGGVKIWPAVGEWRVYILGTVPNPAPMDIELWRVQEAQRWAEAKPEFEVYLPFAEFPLPK
jgi:hypothetical protein